MSTERAVFAVELQDRTSGPALDAVQALTSLKERLEQGTRSLREMQAAMSRLKAGTNVSADSVRELRARMDAQKASVAAMQERYLRMGGTFEGVARGAAPARQGLDALLDSSKALGGPAGALAGRFEAMKKVLAGAPLMMGAVGLAAGLLAIAAAAIAVTAAVAHAAVQLGQYALASADARRTDMLRLEGLMTLRAYQRGGAGTAQELAAAIDRVAGSSALGRSEVSGYGEQLYRAGLRGTELQDALDAVGMTASAQGDRYAQRMVHMARVTRAAGGSVRDLAEGVRRRIGGIAQRQALGFDVQMTRLRENMAHLFDGLNLEPLLRGLYEVTHLFSQQSAFGRALALLFRGLFQPLIGGAGEAGPVIRTFLQMMMLRTLQIALVVVRLRNRIVEAFGPSTISRVDAMSVALTLGGTAAFMLAGALAMAFGPLLLLVAGARAADSVLGALGARLQSMALAWREVRETWAKAGRDLVGGFVQGITSRLSDARAVVQGLAQQTTEALRGALDIHSPSRVFAELGAQIPAGLAAGVERGAPEAADAVARVVEAPQAGGGGRGGPSVGEMHFHIQGRDANAIAESIRDELVRFFAGLGSEMGAAR